MDYFLAEVSAAWTEPPPLKAKNLIKGDFPMHSLLLAVTTHHVAKVVHHAARHAARHAPPPSDGPIWGLIIFGFLFWAAVIALIIWAVVRVINRGQARKDQQVKDQQGAQERRAAIERGGLPQIYPTGIIAAPGEKFIYEQKARWGQTQTHRQSAGASPAIYLPLGHGVRARVGGYKGTSQTITDFQWGSLGTIYVSNMRLAFKADDRTELGNVPYEKINAYDLHPDGLSLSVPDIGTVQLRTGDDCLGLLFKQIVTTRQVDAGGTDITPSAFHN